MAKEARVGIGVFCFKRTGDFIVGKRKGSLGAGMSDLHITVLHSSTTNSFFRIYGIRSNGYLLRDVCFTWWTSRIWRKFRAMRCTRSL
jgi:hypothetical protein